MISLANTDHKKAAQYFYNLIKNEVCNRLIREKSELDKHKTQSGVTLTDYLKNNIKDFLIGDLTKGMSTHFNELKVVFENHYGFTKTKPKQPTDLKKAIDYVFYYDDYDKWNAYELIKKINIDCCPYCNRTYITTLGEDKNKFSRADFDHFLPKYKYPYFRFNFYNLIPSCVICNQKAKGRKDTNLENFIYPYKEGFDNDAKFSYVPSSYSSLKKGVGSEITLNVIDPKSTKGKKIEKNIALFRLKQQYSMHHRELHFILNKKDLHPNGYIEEIRAAFPNLFKSYAEAYEYIFGKSMDEDNFLHQPLSKFTKDIHEELI